VTIVESTVTIDDVTVTIVDGYVTIVDGRPAAAAVTHSATGTYGGLRLSTDAVPPHDLEQAGVICEAQLLGRARDMPVVALQRSEHDPPLGLRLLFLK